jgi:hypothetical protein
MCDQLLIPDAFPESKSTPRRGGVWRFTSLTLYLPLPDVMVQHTTSTTSRTSCDCLVLLDQDTFLPVLSLSLLIHHYKRSSFLVSKKNLAQKFRLLSEMKHPNFGCSLRQISLRWSKESQKSSMMTSTMWLVCRSLEVRIIPIDYCSWPRGELNRLHRGLSTTFASHGKKIL